MTKQLIFHSIIILSLFFRGAEPKTINPIEYIEGNWLISQYLPQLSAPSPSLFQSQFSWAMHNWCSICSKRFKNLTYLHLHVALKHLDITKESISYDRVCVFAECSSSRSKNQLSLKARMELCVSWVIGELKMDVRNLQEAKRVDTICRKLITHSNLGDGSTTKILFTIVKIGAVLVTLLMTINYINKVVVEMKREKQTKLL